jgi:hypothetical protein
VLSYVVDECWVEPDLGVVVFDCLLQAVQGDVRRVACSVLVTAAEEAGNTLSEGLKDARKTQDRVMQARILIDLAELALKHVDTYRSGVDIAETAVDLGSSLNYPLLYARALDRLGRLREALGDHACAHEAWLEARETFIRISSPEAVPLTVRPHTELSSPSKCGDVVSPQAGFDRLS